MCDEFFQQNVRFVRQFCLPQAFDACVFFAIDVGEAVAAESDEFAVQDFVDVGIMPVAFFNDDVIGGVRQRCAVGVAAEFAVDEDDDSGEAELLVMGEPFSDGEIFIIQLDIFIDMLFFCQPCLLETEDAVDVVWLDGADDGAAFVVAEERLDVIAFGGELPAREVG